jgi:hypothetical protein
MLRIYHNHTKWEDLEMYYKKPFDVQQALDFINDSKEFAKSMFRVTCEYKYSCEHNLTSNINRVAWLGQSACFKAIRCPEYITRKAWGLLSLKKQKISNLHAKKCIETWEFFHHNIGVNPISGVYIDSYLKKDYDFIPDELPGELIDLAPAYKFICSAILKNDQHLTTLGYSKPKSEIYHILKGIELNERAASRQ